MTRTGFYIAYRMPVVRGSRDKCNGGRTRTDGRERVAVTSSEREIILVDFFVVASVAVLAKCAEVASHEALVRRPLSRSRTSESNDEMRTRTPLNLFGWNLSNVHFGGRSSKTIPALICTVWALFDRVKLNLALLCDSPGLIGRTPNPENLGLIVRA